LPRSLHNAARIAGGANAAPRAKELFWSVGKPIRWMTGFIPTVVPQPLCLSRT